MIIIERLSKTVRASASQKRDGIQTQWTCPGACLEPRISSTVLHTPVTCVLQEAAVRTRGALSSAPGALHRH